MVSKSQRQHTRAGFTLMEVILATAVAAIVLIAIQTVFFSALRLRTTTTERIESGAERQRALSILRRDLADLAANSSTTGTFLLGLQTSASSYISDDGGERVSPDFFTASGAIDDRSTFADIQCVAYSLQGNAGTDTGRTLCRLIDRNLLPVSSSKPEFEPLLRNVKSISFEYFDGSSWSSDWDSTTDSGTGTMPTAIRVQIELQPTSHDGANAAASVISLTVPVAVGIPASESSSSSSSTSS